MSLELVKLDMSNPNYNNVVAVFATNIHNYVNGDEVNIEDYFTNDILLNGKFVL